VTSTSSSTGILPRLTNPKHPRRGFSDDAGVVLGDVRDPLAQEVNLSSRRCPPAGEAIDPLVDDRDGVDDAVQGVAALDLGKCLRVEVV